MSFLSKKLLIANVSLLSSCGMINKNEGSSKRDNPNPPEIPIEYVYFDEVIKSEIKEKGEYLTYLCT